MDPKLELDLMSAQLKVEFVDVHDRYLSNYHIECKYTLNNYKTEARDRISIFKMGWKSLKNPVMSEWVADAVSSANNNEFTLLFNRFGLPTSTDADELYQFCYINCNSIVQGISTPFQICLTEDSNALLQEHDGLCDDLKKMTLLEKHQCFSDAKLIQILPLLTEKEKEILKLKEENAILRESLKSMIDQRKYQRTKNYDDEINQLKEFTELFRSSFITLQKEVETLKADFNKDKASRKSMLLEVLLSERKVEKVPGRSGLENGDFNIDDLKPIPPFPFE